MSIIKRLKKLIKENGTVTLNAKDFNLLQAEWVKRAGIPEWVKQAGIEDVTPLPITDKDDRSILEETKLERKCDSCGCADLRYVGEYVKANGDLYQCQECGEQFVYW